MVVVYYTAGPILERRTPYIIQKYCARGNGRPIEANRARHILQQIPQVKSPHAPDVHLERADRIHFRGPRVEAPARGITLLIRIPASTFGNEKVIITSASQRSRTRDIASSASGGRCSTE